MGASESTPVATQSQPPQSALDTSMEVIEPGTTCEEVHVSQNFINPVNVGVFQVSRGQRVQDTKYHLLHSATGTTRRDGPCPTTIGSVTHSAAVTRTDFTPEQRALLTDMRDNTVNYFITRQEARAEAVASGVQFNLDANALTQIESDLQEYRMERLQFMRDNVRIEADGGVARANAALETLTADVAAERERLTLTAELAQLDDTRVVVDVLPSEADLRLAMDHQNIQDGFVDHGSPDLGDYFGPNATDAGRAAHEIRRRSGLEECGDHGEACGGMRTYMEVVDVVGAIVPGVSAANHWGRGVVLAAGGNAEGAQTEGIEAAVNLGADIGGELLGPAARGFARLTRAGIRTARTGVRNVAALASTATRGPRTVPQAASAAATVTDATHAITRAPDINSTVTTAAETVSDGIPTRAPRPVVEPPPRPSVQEPPRQRPISQPDPPPRERPRAPEEPPPRAPDPPRTREPPIMTADEAGVQKRLRAVDEKYRARQERGEDIDPDEVRIDRENAMRDPDDVPTRGRSNQYAKDALANAVAGAAAVEIVGVDQPGVGLSDQPPVFTELPTGDTHPPPPLPPLGDDDAPILAADESHLDAPTAVTPGAPPSATLGGVGATLLVVLVLGGGAYYSYRRLRST